MLPQELIELAQVGYPQLGVLLFFRLLTILTRIGLVERCLVAIWNLVKARIVVIIIIIRGAEG